MIELKAHGMTYELWLRRTANEGCSVVEHKALPIHVAEVVAAGNPAITRELRWRGWAEAPAESETMAEARAGLLREAMNALQALKTFSLEDGTEQTLAHLRAKRLSEAINFYTDNVAPPEDEFSYQVNGGETVNVSARRIVCPAGSEPLFDRAVLPDELDEDPELDADETDRQLYAIKHHQMDTKANLLRLQDELGNVASVLITAKHTPAGVEDTANQVRKLWEKLLDCEGARDPLPEGALDPSLAGNLRALLVCLDSDAADNLVEPFAVLERITVLVSELEARAADAEQSLNSAAEQLGKETLARVSAAQALREAQDVTVRMFDEREAARGMVHAAVDLLALYLGGRPIADSFEGTRLNDAIHDWLDLQPESVATSATARFIEKRMGVRDSSELPSPRHSIGGMSSAEFAEGAARVGSAFEIPKAPPLPTDGYGNLLRTESGFGNALARGAFWVLDRLWPKAERESK